MVIGFDAKRAFNNTTGLGNYSRTLLMGLEQYAPHNHYVLFTPGIKRKQAINEYLAWTKAKIVNHKNPLSFLWRSAGIAADISNEQIDIYHGLSNELPFTINSNKVAKVVTIHDLIFMILPSTYRFLDRHIYINKFRFACQTADKVIAVSQNTKKDIVELFNISEDKIEVIYQSCDPIFFEEEDGESTNLKKYNLPADYLLYVGSAIERKNLLSICKAMMRFKADQRIPLVVVGSGGDYFEEVRNYMHQNDASNLLVWINNLQNVKDLKAVYRKAQLFIYPSVYEGFGIPVLEALLSGTPVITSKVSSLPEAGGPSSYLVEPDNIEEIAEGIQTVLTDSALRDQMIQEGFKYAQNFKSEKLAREMLHVYRTLY